MQIRAESSRKEREKRKNKKKKNNNIVLSIEVTSKTVFFPCALPTGLE